MEGGKKKPREFCFIFICFQNMEGEVLKAGWLEILKNEVKKYRKWK
jgi:hypothetical protein